MKDFLLPVGISLRPPETIGEALTDNFFKVIFYFINSVLVAGYITIVGSIVKYFLAG